MCITHLRCFLQDQKDRVEDGPLAACVASRWVTFVRKVANEQGMVEAAKGAADGGACMTSSGGAHNDEGLGACARVDEAEDADATNESIQDDVDCLEIDAD